MHVVNSVIMQTNASILLTSHTTVIAISETGGTKERKIPIPILAVTVTTKTEEDLGDQRCEAE